MKFNFRRGGRAGPLTRGLHILPIFFMLLVAGCSRQGSSSDVFVKDELITPQPVRVGPVNVGFQLDKAGTPVTGAHVSLEGDMTHAGMAPVFGDAHETAPGQYQGQLTLNMAGDWVVLMHITLPDGHDIEKQMNVSGIQSK